MATPSRATPLRRQSSINNMRRSDDDNRDLTRSLQQLTLSTSPRNGPSHLSEPTTPFRSTARRSSHSPNPSPRLPSRSPSNGPSNGRDSRAGTPNLLRKASMNSLRSSNGPGPGHTPVRRASSAHIMSPTMKPMSPLATTPPVAPEKPRPTPSSVANEFFKAELEAHHGEIPTRQTEMIVVLNDAVYGHRFSRPRTSRAALSTIVERPERIRAGVLGMSAAYVRLGQRHEEGAFAIHPKLDVHELPSIPFRIHKTTRRLPLMSQAVTNVHGSKWMEELKLMCNSAEAKLAMGGKELQRPDMNRGTSETPEKFHEGDLYLCSESLGAIEGALGAVCEAVDTVLGPGPRRAFVGARPPGHHCSAGHPSGFCWVNNVHIGIMHGILNHGLTHAAIIDFDLHHGDGSQAITWQHNTRATAAPKNAAAWKKSSIGYFSLHDINSYPCEMGDEEKVKNASLCIDNAHGQTIWNVHLQPWRTEQEFWTLYESKYMILLDKVRNYLQNQAESLKQANQPPKAAIFFSAGFDASEWESAGMQRHKVNVPTEFYARIAQDVIKLAAEEGLHVDGRVISVLEGGYSDRALCSGIFSHISGLAGDQTLKEVSQVNTGLGFEMGQKMGVVSEQEEVQMPGKPSSPSLHSYDANWWASSKLDDLENVLANPLSPPPKPRSTAPPTYFTPTQASTAKVVEPSKVRRSFSGLSQSASPSRPPSPPPPAVPWTIAVHELSKLLIPADRQTESCKPEDLNAEATRARRDRQSALNGNPPAPAAPPQSRPTSRMALRERRTKPAVPVEELGLDKSKNRRKTVATTTNISPNKASARGTPSEGNETQPARRASRRLSGTPTILPLDEAPPLPNHPLVSRPVAPMTSRTQSADTLPMKKSRPTTTTKKETVPKAPRGPKKSTPSASRSGTPRRQSPVKAASSSHGSGEDIDKITSGMKKIRINLITQSQKDARAKARQEGEKSVTPETPTFNEQPLKTPLAVPEPLLKSEPEAEPEIVVNTYKSSPDASPRQCPASDPHIPTPPTTVSSSGLTTPIQEKVPFDAPSPDPRQVALPLSSPTVPSVAIQPTMEAPDVFIPYQPEGPAPVAVAQNEALTWLVPNAPTPSMQTPVATPSPVKQHKNLFNYAGSAGIPFAPRGQAATHVTNENKLEPKPSSSVWDVPETPQK